MGAAFSPNLADIFLSIFFRRFLSDQPVLLPLFKRYIDDIFLLWPAGHNLPAFIESLNTAHPCLKFTHHSSLLSVDYLDLVIYKGERHRTSGYLDLRTFQKPLNLYQYLEFSSCHTQSVFKGLVVGECIRYIRTNSSKESYLTQLELFRNRLTKRNYPTPFINKCIRKVSYSKRFSYLCVHASPPTQISSRPFFKCLPPPQFTHLKAIILHNFSTIQHLVPKPLFISLGHNTLRKLLIRAKLQPTPEQLLDIILSIPDTTAEDTHATTGPLVHRS